MTDQFASFSILYSTTKSIIIDIIIYISFIFMLIQLSCGYHWKPSDSKPSSIALHASTTFFIYSKCTNYYRHISFNSQVVSCYFFKFLKFFFIIELYNSISNLAGVFPCLWLGTSLLIWVVWLPCILIFIFLSAVLMFITWLKLDRLHDSQNICPYSVKSIIRIVFHSDKYSSFQECFHYFYSFIFFTATYLKDSFSIH